MTCRILVVEDSATQAEALRVLLEGSAYEVEIARSGEAAFERVREQEFDLILSDVVMPGITGYELCQRLKQDPRGRALPLVLLTSLSDPMNIVRGLECGADNYITKPYDPEHLLARVRHVLDNRRLRRDSKASLGVTVRFMEKDLSITSEKEQILDLFISSVEDVVRANEALQRSQQELAEAHAKLATYAEAKAREARISTERYFALLQNASDAVFVLDPEGRVLEANPRAADLLTSLGETSAGRSLEAALIEEDRAAFRARFARLAGEGQVQLGEHRFRAGTEGETWCDLTASRTQLDGETLVLLIARDVSERKRAEQALHDVNQRLSTLIEAAPLGILALDGAAQVRLWNPAAERIFGWKEEEVLGERLPFLLEAQQEEHRELCSRVLQGESLAAVQVTRTRRDGTPVELSLSAAPICDAKGETVGVMALVADITEQKQIEAVRREREEAERANRAKSEFLSRMSHELRTPMNAILGFAQLLAMDHLDPEKRESVEQILMAGRHLLALIDEVLDISRIEAGRLSLSVEPVRLGDVVSDAISLVGPQAAQRGISIATEPGVLDEFRVIADLQRLKQVLLNFLSNAVKYNRNGGAVTLFATDVGDGWLRIGVQDTGPGLSPEAMEKLFVPFERLQADRKGIEGTGLGLVLSRGLVEAMGGRIGLESVEGEGSTFWVELLRTTESAPVSTAPDALRPTLPRVEAGRAARSVLYIEDNPSNLRLVERMLRGRPDIRLLVAMQGSLGLELAREHHPDLILLDLNLPDISGKEVLKRLKSSPSLREIPTVVVSADARPDRIEDLRQAGITDYLVKPFDVARFLEVIDTSLHRES